MKRIMRRNTLILLFALAFIGGIGFFSFELIVNAGSWVDQPYNAHVSGSGGLEQAGAIYDRNGYALAQTQDGARVYNDNPSVRRGLLHTVGDNSLNISTAVQSKYRSQLSGYSLIWGLNMPQSMRATHDITLTVDATTCAAAYDVLSSYNKKGACVVYNYKTGEVICSVSTPGYDPANPPEINESNEKEYDGVYLDNVLSSTYTPGSIFKIITSAAAMENMPDLYTRTWNCTGEKEIGGNKVTCTETHGEIDYKTAMSRSCNIAFAEMAVEMGKDVMSSAAKKAGINKSFEVDDVNTAKGHFDVAKADQNQLAWSGIGQYDDTVNPMQMAMLCGAIANGGKAVNPTYIKDGSGDLLKLIGFKKPSEHEMFNSTTAGKLDEVMRYTVSEYYNYQRSGLFEGLSVCAKTGTAEVGDGKNPNAWMVGYSQDNDAPLAFACVVEDSGYGFEYACPVADAAMKAAAACLRGGR
ncbi:MAG TPA: penicillin-binding protein [Ruminococcaceae bacterium]|nr:penicillin-binding protein [Oscillospiraceae bacterium]